MNKTINKNETIIRRVRFNLPDDIKPPYKEMLKKLPYENWMLNQHFGELLALKSLTGEDLVQKVKFSRGRGKDGKVFITDISFKNLLDYNYYTLLLESIREGIGKAYPEQPGHEDTYPFAKYKYDAAVYTSSDKKVNKEELEKFNQLLKGVTGLKELGTAGPAVTEKK